jgi:hypothetical protein
VGVLTGGGCGRRRVESEKGRPAVLASRRGLLAAARSGRTGTRTDGTAPTRRPKAPGGRGFARRCPGAANRAATGGARATGGGSVLRPVAALRGEAKAAGRRRARGWPAYKGARARAPTWHARQGRGPSGDAAPGSSAIGQMAWPGRSAERAQAGRAHGLARTGGIGFLFF